MCKFSLRPLKICRPSWGQGLTAIALSLSFTLIPAHPVGAATNPFYALFTDLYQSYFDGIGSWVNSQFTGLTAGVLGIFDPNQARTQAAQTRQVTDLYGQNNVDHQLARAIAQGNLGTDAQDAAKNEIDSTNNNVVLGSEDQLTVQQLADDAAAMTDTQDIVRVLTEQNGHISDQFQQLLTTVGSDHIHSVIQQATMGTIAAETANTAAGIDKANMAKHMEQSSVAAGLMTAVAEAQGGGLF